MVEKAQIIDTATLLCNAGKAIDSRISTQRENYSYITAKMAELNGDKNLKKVIGELSNLKSPLILSFGTRSDDNSDVRGIPIVSFEKANQILAFTETGIVLVELPTKQREPGSYFRSSDEFAHVRHLHVIRKTPNDPFEKIPEGLKETLFSLNPQEFDGLVAQTVQKMVGDI